MHCALSEATLQASLNVRSAQEEEDEAEEAEEEEVLRGGGSLQANTVGWALRVGKRRSFGECSSGSGGSKQVQTVLLCWVGEAAVRTW